MDGTSSPATPDRVANRRRITRAVAWRWVAALLPLFAVLAAETLRPGASGAASSAPATSSATTTAAAGSSPKEQTGDSAPEDDEDRRERLRRDIELLRQGIARLAGTEAGVLGDLKSLEAEALSSQADLAEIEDRVRRTEEEASGLEARQREMAGRLTSLRAEVARRLAALYRLGRPRYARVLLASQSPASLLSAYRSAAALSRRDALLMTRYRDESVRAKEQAARLAQLRPQLAAERERKARASDAARVARDRKLAFLAIVHADRQTHQNALVELEAAERSVARLLSGLPAPQVPSIGFDRFRGLLDWPAEGAVSARFGRAVNRNVRAAIEHSGLDIDAPFGAPIRSVHDGSVAFAQWLRGYGLTVIVDHGGGWLSIYAHASVLLVEKGSRVERGEKIALVGDTASLRGPYLYFEIREGGRPVDPTPWLRPR